MNIVLSLGTSLLSVVKNPTVTTGVDQVNEINNKIGSHTLCKAGN